MSTSAVEPGTRLAARFRLEDRVVESEGATLWRAVDEVLARPVAVHTFAPDYPRVNEAVTAARAASRLTDPRLTQVFDAADDGETAYVVTEWVSGETLSDLLANGPLEPERAAGLVAEAAEALAHAHEAGLAHLMLSPRRLIWTTGGTVKLLGVGTDAALAGAVSDDPAREDAEGLGRLLYAALTGHWPGPEDCGLPPAPLENDKPCTPRQVTAGVPSNLDAITCRALLQEPRRGLPPLTSPAEVAEALADVPRPVPLPMSPVPPAVEPRLEATEAMPPQPAAPRPPVIHPPARRRGALGRVLRTVLVVLAMVAVGVGAWTLGRSLGNSAEPVVTQPSAPPSETPKDDKKVKIVRAQGFDPLGDNNEHDEDAGKAIDGKDSTEWHTDRYTSADFGRLKKGVGLLVQLEKSVPVSSVVVALSDHKDASLELRVGDSADLDALKPVAKQSGVSGTVTLTPDKEARGKYVLIWFTRLPAFEGMFRGTIYEVMVHSPGSA